jgi:hypothetical protein
VPFCPTCRTIVAHSFPADASSSLAARAACGSERRITPYRAAQKAGAGPGMGCLHAQDPAVPRAPGEHLSHPGRVLAPEVMRTKHARAPGCRQTGRERMREPARHDLGHLEACIDQCQAVRSARPSERHRGARQIPLDDEAEHVVGGFCFPSREKYQWCRSAKSSIHAA